MAAAVSALTVAAFLPGKWTRPLVESGVLPAHAQSSCPSVTVVNFGPCGTQGKFCPNGGQYWIYCDFIPAGITTGYSLIVGGLPAVIYSEQIDPNMVYLQFSLAPGAQGRALVFTVEWGGCPPGVMKFLLPG